MGAQPASGTGDGDDLAAQLELLIEERAVLSTLHRYGHSIDYGLEDGYVDCYTVQGAFETRRRDDLGPSHREEGHDALASYITRHGGAPDRWHKHLLMEPLVTFEGGHASVRSYWTRIDAADDATPSIAGFGRYLDELVKEPDGVWRFVERVAEVEGVDPGYRARHSWLRPH